MYEPIIMEHPRHGVIKSCAVGFSWTVLLFGFFPALIRGDWKWGLVMLACALITAGLSTLLFMFIYNKLYIQDLAIKGYKVRDLNGHTLESLFKATGVRLEMI